MISTGCLSRAVPTPFRIEISWRLTNIPCGAGFGKEWTTLETDLLPNSNLHRLIPMVAPSIKISLRRSVFKESVKVCTPKSPRVALGERLGGGGCRAQT
jgi:hypothetical protein